MITEVRLRNWKSFSDSKLFIDPLTIVIGTNASGKSNIFDALKLLSMLATPIDIQEITKNVRGGADGIIRRGETECNIAVTMDSETESERLVYEVTLAFDERKNIVIKGERLTADNSKKSLTLFERLGLDTQNSSLVSVSLYTEAKPRTQNFSAKTSILSQIEYVNCVRKIKEATLTAVESLKRIKLSNPVPERMRDFTPLANTINEDASNIAGFLANMPEQTQKQTYEDILKYLKPLPDKDIKGIRAEKIPMTDMAMLFCTEEWRDGVTQEQSARGMSDGTLRFAGIITTLVTAEDKSLILLEELDKGVHPSRAKNLVKMLKEISKSKHLDIVCTTHNATFIDELGPQMIPFISFIKRNDTDGCTDINLLEDNENLARLMASKTVGDMMTNDDL